MERADFLEEIVESLVISTNEVRHIAGPAAAGDNEDHSLTKLEDKLHRRCVVCTAAGKKSRSTYW